MILSLDFTILEWIHHNRLESMDEALSWFSAATTYISIIMILIVILSSRFRKAGLMKSLQMFATFFIAALINYTMKSYFLRERPFRVYESIEKLAEGGSSSFPSGHTLEAFAMATVISLLFRRRKIQFPVFIWAILVSYSRLALGVHYPTDILAGVVFGIIIALAVDWGFRRSIDRPYTRT
ncbi:MAG: phosphatase PAP2 family protein [Bacteroidia bacterium]|nr:phosphatase PAP2 family protein [Bacteroidia bacterium]